MIDRVIDRLASQTRRIAISTDDATIATHCAAYSILPDPLPDQPGPLAGILAALTDAASKGRDALDAILSAPCDTPFLPDDLVARLWAMEAAQTGRIAVPMSYGRAHYTTALWPVSAATVIEDLLNAGERRVGAALERIGMVAVDWSDTQPDPFANINTPDALIAAEKRAKKEGG